MSRFRRILKVAFIFFVGLLALRGLFSLFKVQPQRDIIYVLPIEGTLSSSEEIIKTLRAIEKDRRVKAVVLRINSPGGFVGTSQEIFLEIQRIKRETRKKFVASIENVGASGAYYVASACDFIVALPGSLVGSIGVISLFFTAEKLLEKVDVKPWIVKSGKFKDTATPFREPTEEDIKYIKDAVLKLFEQLKRDVTSVRPRLSNVIDSIADGKVFPGKEARELGLVDFIGTFSDAVSIATKISGAQYPKIVWHKKRGWLERITEKLSSKILDIALEKFFVF